MSYQAKVTRQMKKCPVCSKKMIPGWKVCDNADCEDQFKAEKLHKAYLKKHGLSPEVSQRNQK